MHNQKYTISFFNSNRDKLPKQKDLTFEEILDCFNKVVNKNFVSKDNLEAMICGTFVKNERTTESLTCRSIITYDIDKYQYDLDTLITSVKECLKNNTYIYYTTASSTFTNPRLRILVFINNPISRTNYAKISEAVANDLFDMGIMDGLDTVSYSAMQLMYLPNFVNLEFKNGKNVGELIDVSKYKSIETIDNLSTFEDDFIQDYKNSPLMIDDGEVENILSKHDCNEADYHSWLQVGQMLHHQYKGGEKGLDLFINWSLTDNAIGEKGRYDKDSVENVCTAKYKSFKSNMANPVTMRSLIYTIKKNCNNLPQIKVSRLSRLLFPHTKGNKLKPIDTKENFDVLLKEYGFTASYNLILKTTELTHSSGKNYYGKYDAAVSDIQGLMNLNDIPSGSASARLKAHAVFNETNPWQDWIFSKPWDGHNRIEDFYNTVKVNDEHSDRKRLYLRKWIVQMLHITCFNDGEEMKQARGVLVFQSGESKNKTRWIKHLAPDHMKDYVQVGKQTSIHDAMGQKDLVSCAICEWGELDGVFKLSEISALKNFVTRDEDRINVKYQIEHSVHRRRTAFYATVNKTDFLNGEEDNTRFWVIPIIEAVSSHNIDLQQLYAEFTAKHIEDQYWLTVDEEKDLINFNKSFASLSPVIDMFINYFDIDKPPSNWMNCTEVLQCCFYKGNITPKDLSTIRRYLDNNYEYSSKRENRHKWYLPPLKSDKNLK